MPFEKGRSGNPAGRPKAETTRLRETLAAAAPDVITKLIAGAKAGDRVALRLFLERVLPALKPEAARVELDIPAGTLMTRADAVLKLAEAGEIPLDAASEYTGNVVKLVAIEQGTDLKTQLELLMADRFGHLA